MCTAVFHFVQVTMWRRREARDLAHIPELRRGRIWSWALARAPSATQEAGAPCAFHLLAVQPPGFMRKGAAYVVCWLSGTGSACLVFVLGGIAVLPGSGEGKGQPSMDLFPSHLHHCARSLCPGKCFCINRQEVLALLSPQITSACDALRYTQVFFDAML